MFPLRDTLRSRTTPVVNYLLIAVCVAVFILQLNQGRRGGEKFAERYGMIPSRVLHPGKTITVPEARVIRTVFGPKLVRVRRPVAPLAFTPWLTLLTCLFLHAGWLHIIGNMWFLIVFGDNVEDRLGHGRYLLFYLFGGVAASLTHLALNAHSPLPTLGASGAIAGVMGAYFVFFPTARVVTLVPIFIFIQLIEIPAAVFLGIWFLFQLLENAYARGGVETAGVAFWAHIGGFIAGLAIAACVRWGPSARAR